MGKTLYRAAYPSNRFGPLVREEVQGRAGAPARRLREILPRVKKKPAAVVWYDVYCYLFAALNFWTAYHALKALRDPMAVVYGSPFLAERANDQDSVEVLEFAVRIGGWCFLLTGLVFGVAALSLPHAPVNRKAWVAHIVHLVFGASSCVLAPICLPVLFAWFRPEVRQYFDAERQAPGT